MKVISGIYKGRNLKGFNMPGTRPTMDRVKESLFACIQNDLKESVVLDLFSGSASLAIEALSQGAKEAYAVDKNKEAIKTINENIKNIGVKNCKVYLSSYDQALQKFKVENLKFDLIFLDPPYETNYIEKSLKLILELDTPLEKVEMTRRKIEEMLRKREDIIQDGSISVRFQEISDNGYDIIVMAYFYETGYLEYLHCKEEVNYKIMNILQNENVELAYNTQTIYMKK